MELIVHGDFRRGPSLPDPNGIRIKFTISSDTDCQAGDSEAVSDSFQGIWISGAVELGAVKMSVGILKVLQAVSLDESIVNKAK
jgi:hypothetical protein